MNQPLRWGVLGTGGIANKFVSQLAASKTEFAAVASRSRQRALAFANTHGGRAHHHYQELLRDEQVDAVYVALPNSLHADWSIQALEAGKHVLCEKPLATSQAEARIMFDAARDASRVLVEAFMYRCNPAVEKLIEMVRGGTIGEPKIIRTHFTFNRPVDSADVRYQAQLLGGALMDVGCYCVNLARALAGGEPTHMHAIAHWHSSGVDDYVAGILDFGGRTLASFTCGMTVSCDRTTYVGGSDGYLMMDTPWFSEGSIVKVTGTPVMGEQRQTITIHVPRDAYALQADRFADYALHVGQPAVSEEDSLGNMRVLDRLQQALSPPFR